MNLSLDGQWKLNCIREKKGKNPEYGVLDKNSESEFSITAVVPGEVQLDICRAGIEKDPFYSDNYYDYVKYENCGWEYSKTFSLETVPDDELVLRFDGIDDIADVFINGVFVGHTENSLVEHEFVINSFVHTGENDIVVHIYSVMNYARKFENPMSIRGGGDRNQICYVRKSPHSFGWDIFPRIVTAGLWKSVKIFSRAATRITQTYFATSSVNDDGARIRFGVRFVSDSDDMSEFETKIIFSCGDSVTEVNSREVFTVKCGSVFIRNARLWWPRGYGEQNLYTVTTKLIYKGNVVDEKVETIGIRHIRLERSFEKGNQKFCFFVNNVPVFLNGTNWVPADAFHSRNTERIPKIMELVKDTGCNIIRSWGGGLYEDDLLYDLCDRYGVLVWQDFVFGNALFPDDPSFDANVTDEITKVIKRLRNHACVCIWSSDNEIDQSNVNLEFADEKWRKNHITEDVIPKLIKENDPYRQYLKSSPEIPEGFTETDVPEQHTWGARAWFKDPYYRDCTACFIGEAGYHGCPSPESISKFVPQEHIDDMYSRPWCAHSTDDLRYSKGSDRNELMRKQVKILFGEIPDDLETFSFLSQISQAEAFKFFIERTRALRWKRTGIIWWNIADGWPQISDAVVDYYFNRKRAYDVIRRSQNPVLVLVGELSGWNHPVICSNNTLNDVNVEYEISDYETGCVLGTGEHKVKANSNFHMGNVQMFVSDKKMLVIKYKVDGNEYFNHYITGTPGYDSCKLMKFYNAFAELEINNT